MLPGRKFPSPPPVFTGVSWLVGFTLRAESNGGDHVALGLHLRHRERRWRIDGQRRRGRFQQFSRIGHSLFFQATAGAVTFRPGVGARCFNLIERGFVGIPYNHQSVRGKFPSVCRQDVSVFVEEGVTHYCVANMPAAYARTATQALTHVTYRYIELIADRVRSAPDLQRRYSVSGPGRTW